MAKMKMKQKKKKKKKKKEKEKMEEEEKKMTKSWFARFPCIVYHTIPTQRAYTDSLIGMMRVGQHR